MVTWSPPTHVAFSDECQHTTGRLRALGLVSLSVGNKDLMTLALKRILNDCGISEVKWSKTSDNRHAKAMTSILPYVISQAKISNLRTDILLWDTQDARHEIIGRDDVENFHRMYHHLAHHVLGSCWPTGSIWQISPDENTLIHWNQIQYFLNSAADDLGDYDEKTRIARFDTVDWYGVTSVEPCNSANEPLIQVADILAGLAIFSRDSFDRYERWRETQLGQEQASEGTRSPLLLSRAERNRFSILHNFDSHAKRHRLGVSLKTHRGLRTLDPRRPINFWIYEPQRLGDKAPVRRPWPRPPRTGSS